MNKWEDFLGDASVKIKVENCRPIYLDVLLRFTPLMVAENVQQHKATVDSTSLSVITERQRRNQTSTFTVRQHTPAAYIALRPCGHAVDDEATTYAKHAGSRTGHCGVRSGVHFSVLSSHRSRMSNQFLGWSHRPCHPLRRRLPD